jgi:hypothetical protein
LVGRFAGAVQAILLVVPSPILLGIVLALPAVVGILAIPFVVRAGRLRVSRAIGILAGVIGLATVLLAAPITWAIVNLRA